MLATYIYYGIGVLPASRLNSAAILLGSKVGKFARAATVCLGRGYLPPQGHPEESGLLPRHMVLLQHIVIVQRPLLSSFLAWFGVPGSIPCHSFQSSVKEREGSQTGSKNVKSQNLGFSVPTTAWHRLEEERVVVKNEKEEKVRRPPYRFDPCSRNGYFPRYRYLGRCLKYKSSLFHNTHIIHGNSCFHKSHNK